MRWFEMTLPLSVSKYCRCTRRAAQAFAAAVIVLSAQAGGAAEIANPFDPSLPFPQASELYVPVAPAVNPVFSDVKDAVSIGYRYFGYGQGGQAGHFFMLDAAGFSFSWMLMNDVYSPSRDVMDKANTNLFTVNKGFFFNNTFGFGIGYSYASSDVRQYDGYSSFTSGLLLRPARWLSMGYMLKDFNTPRMDGARVKRRELYSASLRPFREWMTLTFDAGRYPGEAFHREDFSLTCALRAPHDISIFARGDFDGVFSFGASAPIGFQSNQYSAMVFDYYGAASGDRAPGVSSAGIMFTDEKYASSVMASKAFLSITLREEVNETEPGRLFAGARPSFFDMAGAVREAAADPGIGGILLRIDGSPLGFAQTQELREELNNFRKSGKKVIAFVSSPGNSEYYLATAADTICCAPNTMLELSGLAAEVYFFKGALDKIGVKVESVSKGKYKSFNEPLTRNRMSDEYRENLVALLSDLNAQYVDAIAADRNIPREKIDRQFAKGGMIPDEAQREGFVDAVAYPDDVENSLVRGYDGMRLKVNLNDYVAQKKKIYMWGALPRIAIVHVDGSIVRGEQKDSGFIAPEAIGDETFRKALAAAFEDGSVRAIVIRVNSGGGSAVASDFMWHSLVSMGKKYRKPVVFSFGNIAASGGYYIACTGARIYASGGTITGSIGVVSGKLSLKRLFDKLGITSDIVKMSEYADIMSVSKDLSDEERAIFQRGVDFTYDAFTGRVADGRKIEKDKLPSVAEGRVFTGKQAGDNGLVDSIGGILAAVEYAKSLSGVTGECEVTHLPMKKTPLLEMLGSGVAEERVSERMKPLLNSFRGLYFGDEEYLYLYPFRVVIK